jgi:hypothetical protein
MRLGKREISYRSFEMRHRYFGGKNVVVEDTIPCTKVQPWIEITVV